MISNLKSTREELQSPMIKLAKGLFARYKVGGHIKNLIPLKNIGIEPRGKLLASHLGIRD